jgi:ubiquinone/menaquinone biosynthesis C-methylase UbiE
MSAQIGDTQGSYDRVAYEYTTRIFDELAHKPFDRHLLNWFAERVQGLGPVCDMGCGPGHVARYLHSRNVSICGMDLAPAMIAQAQHRCPEIGFTQGDMRALDVADGTWGGIVAFYSLIHIPRDEVAQVVREFKRVLQPGGALLLAFHIGQSVLHVDDLWGYTVHLDFVFFQPHEMVEYLTAAGFEIEATIERAPYVQAEYPSRRAYICAGKPIEHAS